MTPLHCHRIEACRQEIVPDDEGAKAWRRDAVHSVDDIARVTRAVADAMIGAGYPETEIYRVHLALEEALVNAHKHGHRGDWGKPVGVRYHVGSDGVGGPGGRREAGL
jgi:Histidine kinase-like ATPase domain